MNYDVSVLRLISEYIVLEGIRRRFTALKIVKAEAGFFFKKLGYLKLFVLKNRGSDATLLMSYLSRAQ